MDGMAQGTSTVGSRFGYQFGALAKVEINYKWLIRTGMMMVNRSFLSSNGTDSDYNVNTPSIGIIYNRFEIPLAVQYQMTQNLGIFGGLGLPVSERPIYSPERSLASRPGVASAQIGIAGNLGANTELSFTYDQLTSPLVEGTIPPESLTANLSLLF